MIIIIGGICARKKPKYWKSWAAKWSSSQEFYDKPRSGQPTALDRTVKKVIEKAKCKRGNSTRKFRKQLKNKGLPWSTAQMWRYTSIKGWKPLRRKNFPLLSKNQRKARKYRFTADSSETFSLAMSALNISSIFPTLKTISYWAHRSQVPPSHQVYGSTEWMVCGQQATASLRYILSRKDRLFHYKKEYSITKILENEVKPLYNRRARKTTAFHEQKQWERPSFKMAHQVIRRKQPRSGARKTSRILAKKIGGQQIHRNLTPLKTYGASFTKPA